METMPTSDVHPPFGAYKGDEPFIFVSYAHRDAAAVFSDLSYLHHRGYRIWYDEGIDPGNEWPDEIASALKAASYFLVFISEEAVRSHNVRNEIYYALNKKKPFTAVYLQQTELTPGLELRMGDIQALHKFNIPEARFRAKIEAILPISLKRKVTDKHQAYYKVCATVLDITTKSLISGATLRLSLQFGTRHSAGPPFSAFIGTLPTYAPLRKDSDITGRVCFGIVPKLFLPNLHFVISAQADGYRYAQCEIKYSMKPVLVNQFEDENLGVAFEPGEVDPSSCDESVQIQLEPDRIGGAPV